MAIRISSTTVIDNSRNLTNIANTTLLTSGVNTFAFRDANCNIGANLCLCVGQVTPLGTFVQGGYLICKATSVGWIVAPITTEVSRTWYLRDDANTRAQSVSGCTGWFVPTISQLQNPGYTCRTFWNPPASNNYWSSTQFNITQAYLVSFGNGSVICTDKSNLFFVRSFRCVAY
jgi:hypothetical protein